MKSEKLFYEIGQIDDNLIEEANLYQAQKKHRWLKVASFIVISLAIVSLSTLILKKSDTKLNLPMLTISKDTGVYYGGGGGGIMLYDSSELKSSNPWSKAENIKTLPVFENKRVVNYMGKPKMPLTEDEMLNKAKELANKLNFVIDSTETYPTEKDLKNIKEKERSIPGNEDFEPDRTPELVTAYCGDKEIKVYDDGWIQIYFKTLDQLESESKILTKKEVEDATQNLSKKYAHVFDMKQPALDLFTHYSYEGVSNVESMIYENSGSIEDRILAFNFNRISFALDNKSELWLINRREYDLSNKVGDYPIISSEKAKELLLQKHYISSVMEQLPDEKYIANVELVYRTDIYYEFFMPYYKFDVELPTMERENGLKTFGAFYVPAVEGKYLTNMPLWDGSLN